MPAGIVSTGSFPKALWPGLNAWFGSAYNEYMKEYTEIFTTKTSTRRYEEMAGAVGVGLAVVQGEGGSISYASAKQGFVSRFVNVVYGKGQIITQDMIDDSQYSDIGLSMIMRQLAFSLAQTKEVIGANVLNNGFTGGIYVGPDQVALLSTAHPLAGVNGTTFSNKLAVDADFSEAALEQAIVDISNLVDDANLRIKVMPQKLIVPSAVQFDAIRVLKSDYRTATADNDVNATKSMGALPMGYRVNHFLTDTDAWFIMTDVPDGLIHFERAGYMLSADDDFDTSNHKIKAVERYSFGWSDPRAIYGSSGG